MLRSSDATWPLGLTTDQLLGACRAEEITALVYHRVGGQPAFRYWPANLQDALAGDAHAAAAAELVARQELIRVLDALARAGLTPVLLKGTPLAYTIYDAPSLRSRLDTDLLVPASQVDAARRTLAALDYGAPPYSAGEELFGQFPLVRRDQFGIEHWIDVHWKISAAQVFADVLTWDELAAGAMAVPSLGPYARSPGTPHALLLACMHPVMHHRNAVRLAWIYDIHLLAGRLDAAGWRSFTTLATEKRLRGVCAHGLNLAREWLATSIPAEVLAALAATDGTPEPTAAYLATGRGWLDELGGNLAARRSWRARFRLLWEIALPSPSFMLGSYGLARGPAAWVALPLLYAHRGLRGVWRVARGKK